MMDNWDMSSGNWIWMTIFMAVGLLVIALVASLLARGTGNRLGERNGDALAVLRRRFAAGEIDEAEFLRRREIMGF